MHSLKSRLFMQFFHDFNSSGPLIHKHNLFSNSVSILSKDWIIMFENSDYAVRMTPLSKNVRLSVVFTQQKESSKSIYNVFWDLVVYRQYIYNCSSQIDPHLAHGGESSIRSLAPLAWLHPPGWPLRQLSTAALG